MGKVKLKYYRRGSTFTCVTFLFVNTSPDFLDGCLFFSFFLSVCLCVSLQLVYAFYIFTDPLIHRPSLASSVPSS